MSALSGWVLSIVGISFVGVLIDLMMPEGEMNKYIKGAFGIITVFVIVSPIANLAGYQLDFSNIIYNQTTTNVDADFLEVTTNQMKKQQVVLLKKVLSENGFDNVEIEIVADMSNNVYTIKKVVIDIGKMVINTNIPHINKYTEITTITTNALSVEESDVIINE